MEKGLYLLHFEGVRYFELFLLMMHRYILWIPDFSRKYVHNIDFVWEIVIPSSTTPSFEKKNSFAMRLSTII